MRLSTAAGRWEGTLSRLPEEWGLGAPPAPRLHVMWVLAAGAGAGGLAPQLPFLPVLTKNRHGKDATCSVRQCVWGMPVQTQPPFSARETQPPVSPTSIPASHSLPLRWHQCSPIQDGGGGWGRICCFPQSLSEHSHWSLTFGRVQVRAVA